ncbi:unnamed protein product [Linum tenue]|uniref:TIR domain-containing protein n=1 Tax=Linum tenue TaxID=586396 RepID=A0AAV0K218_9ROSI|nr:unnamed protein product [Linum tenue]
MMWKGKLFLLRKGSELHCRGRISVSLLTCPWWCHGDVEYASRLFNSLPHQFDIVDNVPINLAQLMISPVHCTTAQGFASVCVKDTAHRKKETEAGTSGEILNFPVMRSSSMPDPPLTTGEYEVFLSFRGPDVRQTFADCLYHFLIHSKIRTFRDEEELRKGEEIAPSLVQAISESKILIPIFSQNYASSKWCLQELAKMVECWKKQGKGGGRTTILPIFYLVDPRDVRHQEGAYEEAFRRHSLKQDQQTIKQWKEALLEVGKMKGWHVAGSDGHGAILEQIFVKVDSLLRTNYTLLTDELVGIDVHVNKVVQLLNLDAASEMIVGIHGMGGIGKTTIAKTVFNKVCTHFDRCCFIEDVRETLLKADGVVVLQNKIISGVLRYDHCNVNNASEGIHMMVDRICKHRVLIVLDDVDAKFEFDKIFGKLGNFSSKSRFIITTRDKRALELLQTDKLHEPGGMSHDHSLQLFSKHAFKMDNPPNEYTALAEKFLKVAAGLPLALKVVGSLLFRTDTNFWRAKLKELKEVPTVEVQQILRISYNELTPNEKQIFLDIACVFIGDYKEVPFYMWSSCDFNPEIGMRTLVNRSLVRIDEEGQFGMHDHLRDLGRAIVNEEDVQNPCKRSRIWSNENALDMLANREGGDQVEVLRVDMRKNEARHEFTEKEFKNLSRLRYLEVSYGRLSGDFKEVLPSLCCLRLHSCDSIPTDLHLKKLVILDLSFCPIKEGWRGWQGIQKAKKLKVVILLECHEIRRVPDLSPCTSLELIKLLSCYKMKGDLHIAGFKNLRVLSLRSTQIAKIITGDMEMLENLLELSLKQLSLSSPREAPLLPTSLKQLSLSSPSVPNLMQLVELEELKFEWCGEAGPEIPAEIWRLSKLRTLEISSASPVFVTMEGSLPSSLTSLQIHFCVALEKLPGLANLTNLTELRLVKVGVSEICGLGELRVLTTLEVRNAPRLSSLDGLENLVLLMKLTVSNCGVLPKLPDLVKLIKLQALEIQECQLLLEMQGMMAMKESLSHLDIGRCPSLDCIEGFESLASSLETLSWWELKMQPPDAISKFRHLRRLAFVQVGNLVTTPDLSGLLNLKRLEILTCRQLIQIVGLDGLESLEVLFIKTCSSIRELPSLSRLKNLQRLQLTLCTKLTHITGFEGLQSLQELFVYHCWSIAELPDLSSLHDLWGLYIFRCNKLTEVKGLRGLESLGNLSITDCRSMKDLEDLSKLSNLRELRITGCRMLTEVKGVERLVLLRVLKLDLRFRVRSLLKSVARYVTRLITRFLGLLLILVLVLFIFNSQ